MFLWEKDHAYAVLAGWRQDNALFGHLRPVELVGQLNQNARPVSHQLVGAHGTSVIKILQDLQTLGYDVVRLLTLQMGDEADAAGIVLVFGPVQAVLVEGRDLLARGHLPFVLVHAGLLSPPDKECQYAESTGLA